MAKKYLLATVGGVAAIALAVVLVNAQAKPRLGTTELSLVGCVELEKDYRARIDDGRGGPLGTGLGTGNEFVLTEARLAPQEKAAPGVAGDYRLTGKFEDNFKRRVATMVEVFGTVKDIKADRSAEDAKGLPIFEVKSWHPSQDYCPAKP